MHTPCASWVVVVDSFPNPNPTLHCQLLFHVGKTAGACVIIFPTCGKLAVETGSEAIVMNEC